ncbi:hypothetical protein VNO78_31284 [Psophocarpus tetragonolobus]|uniref:Glutaredoxin domain-containing protein n=1 Tax=Psophocarpus tetragonolobus TaxID=3891 RepID=A0AAN9X8B3_PSOTE
MWRPWGKSTVRIHSASSSPSSTFSCSSFKDIQSLCLEEPPQHQSHHHQLPSPSLTRKPSVFHRVRLANSLLRTWSTHLHSHPQPPTHLRTLSQPEPNAVSKLEPDTPSPEPPPPTIHFPGAEQRVVVYYTSLRVVRHTFEACKSVLSILRGFRVQIDDRDLSMDQGFIAELNRLMGRAEPTPSLPRVFIAGRYIGGDEEVRQLNEVGELKKLLLDLPTVDPTDCHVCAAHRFVLCDECNGSRKVYAEKTGFKTCIACNENGLVRCPSCFPPPPVTS